MPGGGTDPCVGHNVEDYTLRLIQCTNLNIVAVRLLFAYLVTGSSYILGLKLVQRRGEYLPDNVSPDYDIDMHCTSWSGVGIRTSHATSAWPFQATCRTQVLILVAQQHHTET